MSVAAGTDRRSSAPDRVTRGNVDAPPSEQPVATRLVDNAAEPFPYTKVRDWIALLPASELGDGAFRLYYLSRSVIWENVKGGAPLKPVVEITYEEYATILGRSARTISRFAQDLFATGLWEEVERTHRSIKVPGKARPEVRTVLTVRVHDFPREPWTYTGPVKTWDVLATIRDSKKAGESSTGEVSSVCDTTSVSTQSDQREHSSRDTAGCGTTDLSSQSSTTCPQDQPQAPRPAETDDDPGRSEMTDLSAARTDLSAVPNVSAGQAVRESALKKKGEEEEKPSLPPAPSRQQRESLADELAMFSTPTIQLVNHLYEKTLTTPGLQPLSAVDRIGLARRIESRFAEGWSVSRVRAVLTGGSLTGVKMPGRLWCGRLDEMPAPPTVPTPRAAPDDQAGQAGHRPRAARRASAVQLNDCSMLPDPNAGRSRYEIPDGRGVRMGVRWADSDTVPAWCGRCSSDARTLAPQVPGGMPRACPSCHPEPDAFPPPSDQAAAPEPTTRLPGPVQATNGTKPTAAAAAAAAAV